MKRPDNPDIADVLERIAELLATQHGNPYRVAAYRAAARTLRAEPRSAATLLEAGGAGALERLPTIGPSIAAVVREYVQTGRVAMLERLEGQVSPEDLFTTVPGIGEELAAPALARGARATSRRRRRRGGGRAAALGRDPPGGRRRVPAPRRSG